MANRYGEAALMAARAENVYPVLTPQERWSVAVQKLYPNSPTQQRKGSPKGAFLGLCEEGLVKGIPAGKYTNLATDKAIAVRAVELLREDAKNGTRRGVSALWRDAQPVAEEGAEAPQPATNNSQIDVVLALWNNHLIQK